MSRRPAAAHGLLDCEPNVAVVRCQDEDEATFYRLATHQVELQGIDTSQWHVAPPEWRWFRMSPCGGNCGEHGWHIDPRTGPGRGNWRGSYVRVLRSDDDPRARDAHATTSSATANDGDMG